MKHYHNISDSLYRSIQNFVKKRMGLYFPDNRKKDFIRGLTHAADNFGYKDVKTCIEQLLKVEWTIAQIQTLANYLTIGETYFYRHKEQMEYIFNTYLKTKPQGYKCKIWSAACCSGEEPYSLAILSKELLSSTSKYQFEIRGTDINSVFLKKATKGIYTEYSQRILPKRIKEKYFIKEGRNNYILNDNIRNMVNFNYLNLASGTYPSEMNNTENVDIILCRNVFIYFQQDTINEIVNRYSKCLKDDGLFIVAPAESFMIHDDIFQKCHQKGFTIFKKRIKNKIKSVQKETFLQDRKTYFKKPVKTLTRKITTNANSITKPKPKITDIHHQKNNLIKFKQLFNSSKYEELLKSIEESDTINLNKSDLSEVYMILCKTYANINELEKALKICKKLIDIDKLNIETYFMHSTILFEMNNLDEAEKSLQKVLYLDPSYTSAHFMLGNLNKNNNKLETSIKHFTKAYRLLTNEKDSKILEGVDGLTVLRLKEIIETILKPLGVTL